MSDSIGGDMNERDEISHATGVPAGDVMGHAQWDALVAAYASDELDAAERRDFELHLAGCAVCQAALADAQRIGTLLRALATRADGDVLATPSLADVVLARLAIPPASGVADTSRRDADDSPAVAPLAAARPVLPSDGVLEPESLQWRFQSACRRPHHPALTWHSGVRGLERWRLDMDHGTHTAGEGCVTTAAAVVGDDPPERGVSAQRLFERRVVSRSGRALATVAAVLLVAVLGSILFANRPHGAARGPAANATATSARTSGTDGNVYEGGLTSISMVSVADGWAIGPTQPGTPNSTGNVLLHYTHEMWTRVATPTQASLYGVAMVSASEGWAVGDHGTILRYSGGVWRGVTSPTSTNLYSISMVSATEGWAVGAGEFGGNAVIVHYHDGAWSQQELPALPSTDVSLYSITMVSASEGWAVGDDLTNSESAGLILRYDGTRWVLDTQVPGALVHGVSMDSPTDGWAVGSASSAMLLLHYTGGRWIPVSAPSDAGAGQLSNVSMVSADEGWVVGGTNGASIYDINGAFTVSNVVLLHYSRGHWTSVIPPNVQGAEQTSINAVSMVSANEGWAAGDVIARRGAQRVAVVPLLFHYLNGVWTVAS